MIGERIRAKRTALGLGQEQLARKADIALRVLSSIERGEVANPRVDTAGKIARALGCTVDDLLQEESDDARPKTRRKAGDS
jgi:transcriptional regulator with XRE-family HTH domain